MTFSDNDNMQELMGIFQLESEEIVERVFDSLVKLEKTPFDKEISNALYRDLHSLKGAIRMVGFGNIQMIIHKIEDIFDIIKSNDVSVDSKNINLITKAVELVNEYLQISINNHREIIDERFNSTLVDLEQLVNI